VNTSCELHPEMLRHGSIAGRVDDDGDARYSVWGMIVPRERMAVRSCGTEVVPRLFSRPRVEKNDPGAFLFSRVKCKS